MPNENVSEAKQKSEKPHLSLEKYLTAMGQRFISKRRSLI